MPTRLPPFLYVAVLFILTGCNTSPTHLSLGPPYELAEAARAEVLMPLPIPAGVVRVTDDQGEEHDQPDRTGPMDRGEQLGDHPGERAWRMSVAGFWVVDVVREPTGGVSILREIELAESRRVEYDPPLPLLPASLTMGLPVEFVSRARVYDHDSGALLSAGDCTAVYRLLGSKQIELPGRTVRVSIVRTDRRFDLPWVKVDMQIISAYVPGEGTVAWVTKREIRLLGLLPVTRENRAVRVR